MLEAKPRYPPNFFLYVCPCGKHEHADGTSEVEKKANAHQAWHAFREPRVPKIIIGGHARLQMGIAVAAERGLIPVVSLTTLGRWLPSAPGRRVICPICLKTNPQAGLEAFSLNTFTRNVAETLFAYPIRLSGQGDG